MNTEKDIRLIETVEQFKLMDALLVTEQDTEYFVAFDVHKQELYDNTIFMLGLGTLIGIGIASFVTMIVRML